jgi:D-arabinose 5-phosphate isomerase GutQ
VRREAQALLELAERLEQEEETDQDSFTAAVDALKSMEKYGKVLFAGVGKSGLLARKAVATFNSLGEASITQTHASHV